MNDLLTRLDEAYKSDYDIGDLWNLCDEAADRIRELESINADILATVDQFLRDEGYSDEEVGEFLCPLVMRLKEQPR